MACKISCSYLDEKTGKQEIGHCIIDQREKGFGFAEPFYIHRTLNDLVEHYNSVSLAEYNNDLNVTLKYPINMPVGSTNYTMMH